MPDERNVITIGIFADAHYADVETKGNRHYRESLEKVRDCIEAFNLTGLDFAVFLGDLIDGGGSAEADLTYLKRVEGEYARFGGERHYVLGNHDLQGLSKDQFIAACGARGKYYYFDKGDLHFVILDGCYNEDESDYNAGNFHWTEAYIPLEEQKWLEADLQATDKRTLIFIHQRLDDDHGSHGIGNASEVRNTLERSGKVLAVFQGHDHSGAHRSMNGIQYYTMPAMVEGSGLESNACAIVRVWRDGFIKIEGTRSSAHVDRP